MAGSYEQVIQSAADFLRTYVLPYLIVLAIAFVTTGFAVVLLNGSRKRALKSALRAELMSNVTVTEAIVAYADSQLNGETSVAPMPRYRTLAFQEYSNAGLLERLPRRIAEELEQVYLNIVSVNKAGRRQEDLAFGPAAAFPNAHTLRLENLTFVRDTAHNIIDPYQDRLKDITL